MNRIRLWYCLLVTVILQVLSVPEARAQVRSYTVGLDVNCPSGLGE